MTWQGLITFYLNGPVGNYKYEAPYGVLAGTSIADVHRSLGARVVSQYCYQVAKTGRIIDPLTSLGELAIASGWASTIQINYSLNAKVTLSIWVNEVPLIRIVDRSLTLAAVINSINSQYSKPVINVNACTVKQGKTAYHGYHRLSEMVCEGNTIVLTITTTLTPNHLSLR